MFVPRRAFAWCGEGGASSAALLGRGGGHPMELGKSCGSAPVMLKGRLGKNIVNHVLRPSEAVLLQRFSGTAVRVGDVERGSVIEAAVPIKVPGVDPVLPACRVLLGEAVVCIKLHPVNCCRHRHCLRLGW